MKWMIIVNDVKCKQELKQFLNKNSSSILFKTNNESAFSAPGSEKTTSRTKDIVAISSSNSVELVNTKHIVRCQSLQNYTQIYLKNGKKIISTKTLKYFEILLSEKAFVRIHQSHLVNLFEVSSIQKSKSCVLLNDGTELPIATRKKESLLHQIEKL